MYLVEIVVRHPVLGDSRALQWQLDPDNFGLLNWDRAFPSVQAAVQDLQLADGTRVVPLL